VAVNVLHYAYKEFVIRHNVVL